MAEVVLKAEKRKIIGRKVKKLRKEKILPANLFGKKIKSVPLQVNLDDFIKVFNKVGETGLVELCFNGKSSPVLIHNLQKDPVTDNPIHVDFMQVDLKEKVSAKIPIELVGESPAEKQGLGTVVLYVDEIEVEALPKDLPKRFEINLENLTEVGQSVCVKDINIDTSKVFPLSSSDQILVKVEPPKKEEVVEVKPPEEVGEEEKEGAEGLEEKEKVEEQTPES